LTFNFVFSKLSVLGLIRDCKKSFTFIQISGIITEPKHEQEFDMEVVIKKVDNGFVVEIEKDVDGDYEKKTLVFTKFYQVQRFIKENLKDE
jgi:hypothetical protein